MDGIIKNTFTFNKSLLVLKDVNVINKRFKERCFLLWNKHMLFLVFMFCKSNNDGVVIELCGNVCFTIRP